jgi:hypothetical protein
MPRVNMIQMTANREMVGMRRELLSSSPLLSSGTDPTSERVDKNSLEKFVQKRKKKSNYDPVKLEYNFNPELNLY